MNHAEPGQGCSQQLKAAYLGMRGPASRPSEDATKAELYEQAKEAGIAGRSTMSKDELKAALDDETS